MKMLRARVTREQLFEADEFSCDWRAHQLWRLEQCKQRVAQKHELPIEKVHLVYQDKQSLELMNRKGDHVIYRPEGIITEYDLGCAPAYFMEFEVAWVDPWGYAQRATRTFLDIMIKGADEFTYLRRMREIRIARDKHRV
jgi:hypothetical protein